MPSINGSEKRGEPTAPCRSLDDLSVFFPQTDGSNFRHPTARERIALRVCATCPLARRAACLDEALSFPLDDQYGVVGGTTAIQRKTIIRGRQAAKLIGVAA
ncbi:WhiB family transcriptional regulator [Kitasatospora sp. NPDC058162]|uniref:WhiB family transcriptional regulator n=1 Tax=Kitasatospora sp. NPDC058162 TaxID=3346362 RepID=UPI0036D844BD